MYQLAAAHRLLTSLPPGGPPRSRYNDAASAPSCCEPLLSTTIPALVKQEAPGRHEGAAAATQSDSCSSASSEVQQGREDTGGLVKGAWSSEEDTLLLQYVQVSRDALARETAQAPHGTGVKAWESPQGKIRGRIHIAPLWTLGCA